MWACTLQRPDGAIKNHCTYALITQSLLIYILYIHEQSHLKQPVITVCLKDNSIIERAVHYNLHVVM
jgi:hypothetical protein